MMPADDQQLLVELGLEPGANVAGKYRIESLIASGGMGAVLLAHHEVLDQPVAIKVMRPELASEREAAQRFLREARAAAKIASDYVCRVTDVDLLDDSTPYMVMEYLQGEDLDALVEGPGVVVVSDAVDYVMQALAGLEAAHAIGIVHRDLKPSNLFLVKRADGSRRVKVLDFGISKVMEENSGLKAGATTSTHAVLGTPRYMSPEQISSAKDVDARTDLWAVGLILYELLAKLYPFEGDNAGALLASVLTSEPPPLRSIRRDVPPELHAAVHRCLAKNREHRFKSARSLLKALGPFASRRVQALLLSPEELAPAIATTESLGTPSEAVEALRSQLDGDDMPTLEASVASAMGELDMSREELDALADKAAEREREAAQGARAGSSGRTFTPATSEGNASPFEATAQLADAAAEAGLPPDDSGTVAAGSERSTTDTAVSIPMQRVGSSGGKGMLVGIAAVVAVGILGGGVWFISRSDTSPSSVAESGATAPSAETPELASSPEPPPAEPNPEPASPEPTGAVATEPSSAPSANSAPSAAPPSAAPPSAAPAPRPQPSPRPGPRPATGPKPAPKPKPGNLDALLGERD